MQNVAQVPERTLCCVELRRARRRENKRRQKARKAAVGEAPAGMVDEDDEGEEEEVEADAEVVEATGTMVVDELD